MRPRWAGVLLVVVLALALVNCSAAKRSHGPALPVSSAPAQPGGTRVSAKLRLQSTVVAAGGTVSGTVVVVNDTGAPIHTYGCGGIFQVLLTSGTYHPTPMWATCLQPITIPTGTTNFVVTADARCHSGSTPCCTQGIPIGTLPTCAVEAPFLPPGSYEATTFERGTAVPVPSPVPVVVRHE